MRTTPLVTIAIPTYNRADSYLEQALERASEQTYENIEILVSDNCSTDRTPEIIEAFDDPRLRYYRQEKNLGQRPNMNFLVEKARGDYFLMYHDDDQIDLDFIETCLKAADFKTDTGLILTGSGVIDEDGNVLRTKENLSKGLSTGEFILSWFQKKVHMFFCASLFNTEALRDAGGFKKKYNYYDDVAAEFKCAASHGRIDVKAVKSRYREHTGSYNKRTGESDLINWCESSHAIIDLACELAPSLKDEIWSAGRRTSAERVYRHAAKAYSKIEQLKGYWIVYKSFNYQNPPTPLNWYQVFPFLEKFRLIMEPRNFLSEVKHKYF